MSYNAGSIVAYIQLNKTAWDRPLGVVRGDIANLSRLSESLGRKMLALSATIVGVGVLAVREFGKFEHAMRIATSVSNMTATEFKQASENAIEVSKRWNIAAITVADAYLFLGRAGLTAAEQLKAVEPIAVASKAMLTDLETTAEGVINIIRAFGYTFEATGQIVGQVTYAANKSTQSLEDILIALSYAGKPAQAANTTFQQLAGALSIAANQGIRGSKAGVAIRYAFTSLMRPTRDTTRALQRWNIEVYDSEHRMKPLPDLLQSIEEGLAGCTEEQRNNALATIVGVRATATWLTLLSAGSGALREWTANIDKAGNEAEDVARLQLKALAEKWGLLKKHLQAVVYALVDQFTPGLKGATDSLTELAKKTEDWIKANKDNVKEMVKSIANLGILTAKIGLVLLILPKLINFSASLVSAITSPIILAVAAIYGLSVVFREELTKIYNAIKKFWDDSESVSKPGASRLSNAIANILPGDWGKRVRIGMAAARHQEYRFGIPRPEPLGLKMKMPTGQGEGLTFSSYLTSKKNEWIDTIKSDFENMKKLMGGMAESILPPEALAGWNELKKILDDLASTLANTQEGFEKTGEAATAAIGKKGGEQVKKQFADWDDAVIDWHLAVNDVLDTLPSLREGFEKALAGINTTFRDSIRGWMDDMSNFSGFLKSIYRGILNIIKDFVADAIATQLQLWMFKGQTTEASQFKNLMTGRGLLDIGRDWLEMRSGGGADINPYYSMKKYAGGGIVSKPTLAMIGEKGPERVLNSWETANYNRKTVPNISFNITNEIPGAELAVHSAEGNMDGMVLNATMRLASSNTMFRRTFVNPGGR